MEEEIKQHLISNMFKNQPDVVGFETMRKMLGGIGKKSAYKLLQEKKIYAKKVAREYKIPKICIINYLLNN